MASPPPGQVGTALQVLSDLDFSDDFDVRDEALQELEQRLRTAPSDLSDAPEDFVPEADEFQSQVIESNESTIRLVAPAGSGKTQTMINRVLRSIRDGAAPDCILMITFDNSAAGSLREKLADTILRLGGETPAVAITTLNAYGYRLLRERLPDEFKPVLPGHQRVPIMKKLLGALAEKDRARRAAIPQELKLTFHTELFSLLKNELFDPRDPDAQAMADFLLKLPQAAPFFPSPGKRDLVTYAIQAILWLFMAYEKELQNRRVLDFDDQKLRPCLEFERNPSFLSVIQAGLSQVVVDEFQDINRLDFVLIDQISRESQLVVTGDDDQAIYGFRGCSPKYIIELERELGRPVKSFELRNNYRCPATIVAHADTLIRKNEYRVDKKPIARNSSIADIKVVSAWSAAMEAKLLVTQIKSIREARPTLLFRDFAILYRTNAQSLPLQVELLLNEMPFRIRPEHDILQNEVLERLLAVLRIKIAKDKGTRAAPKDVTAAIRSYFRYMNRNEQEAVERQAERARVGFLEFLESSELYSALPKAQGSDLARNMKDVLEKPTLIGVLDSLARNFRGLQGMLGSLDEVLEERVPLGEIYDIARAHRGDVTSFVGALEKAIDVARAWAGDEDADEVPNAVELRTYFRAKGLQWHTVLMAGCNEGVIPHKRAPIEDERRLFYVAMTRASSNLLLSYYDTFCGSRVAASRFIHEAGLA